MDDSSIVDLFLAKNEEAIRRTKEKYGARLRALSYNIVCDRETAEECENDTYMKTWSLIPPHEPRTYLYPFLAKIARNLSLNICRARQRLKRSAVISELSAEMEQCIPSPDDCECAIDDIALKMALNTFLKSLSREKRNIFLRRYWFLDSVAVISDRFGLSESSVKTTLFRCRVQLRQKLIREGYTL